ncbi:MAG: AbrB family transcriptional regulator [Tumebacillaceae bacterium]
MLIPTIETLLISLLGAFVFHYAHIPLPFILGPMTAVTAWRLLTKRQLAWPSSLRNTGLLILGCMLGSSFTRDTVGEFAHDLPLMLLATLLLIGFSLFLGYWVARASKVNMITAIFGFVPGGLTQMVAIADEIPKVDITIVTFMQTVRLMGVIFIVPFLAVHGIGGGVVDTHAVSPMTSPFALNLPDVPTYSWPAYIAAALGGAWIAQRIKLQGAFLLGPLFSVAMMVLFGLPTPQLPNLLVTAGQLLIAAHLGLSIKPGALKNAKLTSLTVLSSIVLVLFSLLLGWLLSLLSHMETITGFLSTAPGGMAEMGVTAKMVDADLSMVSGYHLFRLFFIMFVLPPLLQWWVRRRAVKLQ